MMTNNLQIGQWLPLPTSEILSLNPVVSNFYFLPTVFKNPKIRESGNGPLETNKLR